MLRVKLNFLIRYILCSNKRNSSSSILGIYTIILVVHLGNINFNLIDASVQGIVNELNDIVRVVILDRILVLNPTKVWHSFV